MVSDISSKILIVDDEPEVASSLKDFLESEGYDVKFTGDGKTALSMMLNGDNYTLVLLDICMPELDGIEVLKLLQDNNCNAAVIMMSGYSSEELAVECMRNGADDYIVKPFAMESLLQRIKKAKSHRQALIEKKQLEQEKDDFSLMLSHDMKNPMTAVIGSIDIIREGRLGTVNEEQAEYLQSAIDSCNEVIAMIDNLLDVRRFEAGKMPINIKPHDVESIIRKVAEQFMRTAEHDDITLSLDICGTMPMVMIDSRAMHRILGNLLTNSLKFTPQDGNIVISCNCVNNSEEFRGNIPQYLFPSHSLSSAGSFVKITVRDTGTGIRTEDIERIFDRYAQSKSGTGREQGGAGLGLTFSKWAVESFGGVIWAESEVNHGSSFVILLPLIQ